MACLDDNLAVEFAAGTLGRGAAAKVEAHLASCRNCRTLVAALAPQPGEPDSDIVTSPRLMARGKRRHGPPAAAALAPTDPRASEPRRPREPVVVGGDTIGRYIVLRRLGAGGMGVVYAAYDPQLDRKVALKLLRTGTGLGQGEARARLIREAQAIARLSHPNVVAVYDVGTADSGEVYVAMEFVEGDTLTQWLTRWVRPWREVLDVFREAGRGLAAAHAVGLLHRDFKPDNVLVGADGRVRVTDFGLARSLVTGPHEDSFVGPSPDLAALRVQLTATGTVMGTPRYMAPEQLAGLDVGAAADQFSFCVALYEALYGKHPITGDTAAKMVDEGARAQAPPDDAQVPPWIAPLLLRGLDLQPARRYPSMSALLSELTPPVIQHKRRTVAVLGAAALVLGGGGAATMLVKGVSAESDLEGQVVELVDQRDRLRVEIERLIEELDRIRRERTMDEQRLKELSTELAIKAQEVEQLEATIRQLTSDAAVAAAPRPKPARLRAEGGLRIEALRTTIKKVQPDVKSCLAEWVERKRALAALPDEAGLTVRFTVTPEGRVQQATASGLEDRVVPDCVVMALRRTAFPTSPDVTVATLNVRLYLGQIAVTVERLGSEPAVPRTDIGVE